MNTSLSPPFYELDEYTFQDLCCDVFARQPGIATCDVYGTRGQRQRGIDLLARRTGSDGIEVGQCKRYLDFPPTEIRQVSNEFFRHLAYWQQRNVKRFLLFVACDLDRTQQLEAIDEQTERFVQYGIEYEAWSANTLRLKLAPYPDIVLRHTQSEYWATNICGRVTRAAPEPIGSLVLQRDFNMI